MDGKGQQRSRITGAAARRSPCCAVNIKSNSPYPATCTVPNLVLAFPGGTLVSPGLIKKIGFARDNGRRGRRRSRESPMDRKRERPVGFSHRHRTSRISASRIYVGAAKVTCATPDWRMDAWRAGGRRSPSCASSRGVACPAALSDDVWHDSIALRQSPAPRFFPGPKLEERAGVGTGGGDLDPLRLQGSEQLDARRVSITQLRQIQTHGSGVRSSRER
jgi:hypothetical protein